ncbi:hypothetical protein GSI_07870 [Ganoderma sinense ZZ0214-1]|uniref:UvrD-like helicase ATP-binding domain-containing protein n=1 Tax=Ganoderma sinense ZZ0214-1 TaxID=1077348 RepID=A0A2G8S855_9APHY|nr:hypothetical protein GSI_07870 [Ganoderma sinense ZZ0214-1]
MSTQSKLKDPRSKGRAVGQAVLSLLDKASLHDEAAIDTAIANLDHLFADTSFDVQEVVEVINTVPHLLEFILSASSDYVFDLLSSKILKTQPKNAEDFPRSLVYKLLDRFSVSLCLRYQRVRDTPPDLVARKQSIPLAFSVLQAISLLNISDTPIEESVDVSGTRWAAKIKEKQTQKRKRSIHTSRAPTIDTKPIIEYGAPVPTSKSEASELAEKVIAEQMAVLRGFLDAFRDEKTVAFFKSVYLPSSPPPQAVAIPAIRTEGSVSSDSPPVVPLSAPSQGAFPLVQPMKAALYFDSAKGFGQWRVLISTRADQDLRQARRRDAKLFQIFVKKIKELSNGHFSDDNQKRLTGTDVAIPVYEAKMTGDTRLVYQVDCVPEFESDVERQVLKIFGIYTHAQLDRRFWDCVGRQLEQKGLEYRNRCTFRNPPVNPGDNVFMPASWPPPAETPEYDPMPMNLNMRKEDYEELHSLLVLGKFVTFSQALLNSILADKDVAHVFEISPYEKKIIEHPSSCYVLGRSGTGKTTAMLFKMLGIERAWEMHRDMMPKPRQLFVTQSRVLAEKVEEYFAKLLESLASAGRSPTELRDITERQKHREEQGLVDRDEEIYWRGDLPKRYGALKEEHFPMFLTYDHVCRLLESEFWHLEQDIRKKDAVSRAIQDALELQEPNAHNTSLSNDYMQQRRTNFVSFGTFLEEYWPHFPQALTKGLDPTLVFGEFMGVIKGSELALGRQEGYLTEEAYNGLSHRTQGTFSNQREVVYKLFETYVKRKKMRGDYDAADRTHSLVNALRSNGVPGEEMDFIYVDEAQDNLLIDALVLRTLCRNPHGMFWPGDTAQTISVGSAFRFNDLKAFLYRVEETNAGANAERRTQPESFHLAVNYRSHAGIVDCAHSVIELISQFWPHAIDALAPEQGLIHGLRPVFFSGWDQNTARYEQFLFGESGSHIEFGAEQCILVRDDAARDKLRSQVGDIGLIMTLYESKGLEFNDVLLYNFFEDSMADLSQWRVVLNALPQDQRAANPAPRFDDARHSGICRELKFLYVAITRARKNLWIADGSEKGEPMRIVWTHKDQIQNCTPGTDVPRLAMSSTAEDWAKTAQTLFNNRRYMQAMHCYERAGKAREKAVACAYYLREVARMTPIRRGDTSIQTVAFVTAAEAFIASAQTAITEKKAYYRIAAQCYVDSGDDYKAAQAYASATEYTLAAQHYRKAGKFEEAVDVIKQHKGRMQSDVVESIVDVSKLYFLREKEMKKALELFNNDEEALEYMDDFGLDMARAQFLEEVGRYAEAADVHISEGNTLEAIRVLSLDTENKTSLERALACLLDGLWRNLSCGVPVNDETLNPSGVVGRLLQLANSFTLTDASNEVLHDEILMFRSIAGRDMQRLLELGEKFTGEGRYPAAFLCLDRVFSMPLKLQASTLPGVAKKLNTFHIYARMLQKLWTVVNPCNDPDVRQVFAIECSTEDLFLIDKDSLLASHCNDRFTPSARKTDQGLLIPRWELERLLKYVLKGRLTKRVNEENNILYGLRLLQPCLSYALSHRCNRVDCPRTHIDAQRYNADDYNLRVRVHIIQILIYQTLYVVEHPFEQARHQRHWLRRLYEAIYPPYYKLGSVNDLSPALIPEFDQGKQVIRVWVQDLLYAIEPHRHPNAFLTNLVQSIRLALKFDQNSATEYLHRLPTVMTYRPPMLLRDHDKSYVVHYFLDSMKNSDENALNKGVLFMNHILEKQISIDIGVLCDFMDHLCGSFILASRMRSTGNLNDVTLPKSWISHLSPTIEALCTRDTQLVKIYKVQIIQLLEPIYTGEDVGHLLFEGRELSSHGHRIRSMFFARICRNLCLWGYNYRIISVCNGILNGITSVRKPGRIFSPLIEQYVDAKTWDHLARAVRHSVTGSNLDEMIQLHYGPKLAGKKSLFNVRLVAYERLDDIPRLLKTDESLSAHDRLQMPMRSFVSAPSLVDTPPPEEYDPEEPHAGEDAEQEEVEHPIDVEDVAQAINTHYVTSVPTEPTAEEKAAAKTIAEAYQKYLARKSVSRRSSEEMRRRIYATFSAQAAKMDWPQRYYRMLFLGPIPHLYIVVEGMKNHLHDARSVAKKRFSLVKHLELENMGSTLTQMNQSFKDAIKLHQTLGPTSDLHKTRDLEKLKACAREAETFMRSLSTAKTFDWEKDMKIALRGIVEVKKTPIKQPKPELNVEDLEDC